MKLNILDDCENYLKSLPDRSIDTIITDAPYAIKFKNRKWDYKLPSIDVFKELLRVSKPGSIMLIFGGTRTFHRLACNVEDAGWNIIDTICWIYGQGFPKSVDIGYMIDKKNGKFGEEKQRMEVGAIMDKTINKQSIGVYEPGCEDSKKWNGWGTALKPSWEPILICVKSIEGNYEDNAVNNGVCGFWIDGARIGNESFGIKRTSEGRWPANSIHDDLSILPENARRFFYCPKVSKKEREEYNTHETLKPLELMKYLCNLTKTPSGGVVLDPYSGSGTTAIACLETGRDYLMIDNDENYYSISERRIAEHNEKI